MSDNKHVCATSIDRAGKEYEPNCDACWAEFLASKESDECPDCYDGIYVVVETFRGQTWDYNATCLTCNGSGKVNV